MTCIECCTDAAVDSDGSLAVSGRPTGQSH